MNAETYLGDKWVDQYEFESDEVHQSGRVVLRGVTSARSQGGEIPRSTVLLPADLTIYIKED